jgi:hypothetical protein
MVHLRRNSGCLTLFPESNTIFKQPIVLSYRPTPVKFVTSALRDCHPEYKYNIETAK